MAGGTAGGLLRRKLLLKEPLGRDLLFQGEQLRSELGVQVYSHRWKTWWDSKAEGAITPTFLFLFFVNGREKAGWCYLRGFPFPW